MSSSQDTGLRIISEHRSLNNLRTTRYCIISGHRLSYHFKTPVTASSQDTGHHIISGHWSLHHLRALVTRSFQYTGHHIISGHWSPHFLRTPVTALSQDAGHCIIFSQCSPYYHLWKRFTASCLVSGHRILISPPTPEDPLSFSAPSPPPLEEDLPPTGVRLQP